VSRTIQAEGTWAEQKVEIGDVKEVPSPFAKSLTSFTQSEEVGFEHSSIPPSYFNPSFSDIAKETRIIAPQCVQNPFYTKQDFFLDLVLTPYLPPNIQKLLRKSRLTEQQKVDLMTSIAKSAIEHYELRDGLFVAVNLSGQIREVSDTKIELLKRIQRIPLSETVFVWKVGSDSFSGWY